MTGQVAGKIAVALPHPRPWRCTPGRPPVHCTRLRLAPSRDRRPCGPSPGTGRCTARGSTRRGSGPVRIQHGHADHLEAAAVTCLPILPGPDEPGCPGPGRGRRCGWGWRLGWRGWRCGRGLRRRRRGEGRVGGRNRRVGRRRRGRLGGRQGEQCGEAVGSGVSVGLGVAVGRGVSVGGGVGEAIVCNQATIGAVSAPRPWANATNARISASF